MYIYIYVLTAGVLCGGDAGHPPLRADLGVARPLLPPGAMPRVDALPILGGVQGPACPQG